MYKLLRSTCLNCHQLKMAQKEVDKYTAKLQLLAKGELTEAAAVAVGGGKAADTAQQITDDGEEEGDFGGGMVKGKGYGSALRRRAPLDGECLLLLPLHLLLFLLLLLLGVLSLSQQSFCFFLRFSIFLLHILIISLCCEIMQHMLKDLGILKIYCNLLGTPVPCCAMLCHAVPCCAMLCHSPALQNKA